MKYSQIQFSQSLADIDLFQLGLTMLQISTGFDLAHTTAEELRQAASIELDPAIARFFLKLSDEDESKRFRSAESALSSLRAVTMARIR